MEARTAVELIVYLRYLLRMLGVPLYGYSVLFGDNQAVVNSSTNPSYCLKKRQNMMAFHYVREAVAAEIIDMYHISSEENPADIMTNLRISRAWYKLMRPLLCWSWRDKNSGEQDS